MILPRTSIRGLFWLLTVAAVLFFVMKLADNGQSVAIAVTMLAVFLLLTFVIYSAAFSIVYVLGLTFKALDPYREQPSSPFVDAGLPDQIVPPVVVDAE